MKRLVMIDGNSLLFRAYFAMREMRTKDGIYTQGVFAFINMLQKILNDYEPDYIGVAFDMKAKTFRHQMYPEYKAGRLKTPVELLSQIPLMHEVLDAMNITVLEKETFEADDIIGTMTARADEAGLESIVITGDKDALQLVGPNTKVVINRKGMTEFDLYDEPAMMERYELTPSQFIDLKGLMGDKSDNIPGIPGVGEKKGIALLKEYGSMDGILDHADQIKGKLGENVRANVELAVLSKELATIKRDVPIDIAIEDMRHVEPNRPQLIEVYKRLEFQRFLKALESDTPTVSNADSESTIEVKEVTIDKFYSEVANGSTVVLEMNTDDNHTASPNITSFSLFAPKEALYSENLTALLIEPALQELSSHHYSYIGRDLKRIAYAFISYGIKDFKLSHDIEVAEYLIEPNKSKYMLDNMVLRYFNESFDESDSVKTMTAIYRVAEAQRKVLKDEELMWLFEECEMPLIETLAAMEYEGIRVNADKLDEIGKELDKTIAELSASITAEAGKEFNINSPKQLAGILFEDLQIPYPKQAKGKSGYSTAADILDRLKDDYPIVSNILRYRKAAKLKSTYIDGLRPLISLEDSKIRPHFRQTVAATGRLSCTEPNLQNIPIRDEDGRNIRKAFVVSDDNNVFIGADYSQIELRIMAALSEDPVLIDAFNRGDDIHRLTASRVFNIPIEEVTPLDRSRAKAVNFGVVYGISGFGLSENLGITRKDAQKYIDDYFEKHIAVKRYLDHQIELGERDREVRTIYGRLRQIPEFNSRRFNDIQFAHRLAMNTPIQGSAADIIKIAMNKVYYELKERKMKSRLILQIHDELIVEAVSEEVDTVKELLARNMEQAADLSVRLVSDMHSGSSWYDLK